MKVSRLIVVFLTFSASAATAQRGPVIDVHLHSYTALPPAAATITADDATNWIRGAGYQLPSCQLL